jgi:hypothetical protein
LKHDDELDAAAFEPPSDLYHFAKARMKPVGDTGLRWVFVGSMSPFRGSADLELVLAESLIGCDQ